MVLTVKDIIQIIGIGLVCLGLMLMPRWVPREQPLLPETGFTRMADGGAFDEASKFLLGVGAVVFLISFIPLPSSKTKERSPKPPKR